MISLDTHSRMTKIFLWCLWHPMARGKFTDESGVAKARHPNWYIENGTTLCHFFWVCLWLPRRYLFDRLDGRRGRHRSQSNSRLIAFLMTMKTTS